MKILRSIIIIFLILAAGGIGFWHASRENKKEPDKDVKNFERGLAIQDRGDRYMLGSRDINVAQIIFSGKPYASLVDTDAASPILTGIKRLYEHGLALAGSDGVYPISHYRIAEWYIGEMLNNPALSAAQKETYMSNAKKEVFLGDAAQGKFFALNSEKSRMLYVYWLKGKVEGDIALIEKDEAREDKAEHAFEQASRMSGDDGSLTAQKIWASLYYAIFLERRYGHARAYDIIRHLRFIAQKEFNDAPVMRFFERLPYTGNEYAALKRDIASVAIYDDSFADFLRKLGWAL